MKHLLIILISILLLSSPVIGTNHNIFHQTLPVSGGKGETSTKIYTNLVKFVYLQIPSIYNQGVLPTHTEFHLYDYLQSQEKREEGLK